MGKHNVGQKGLGASKASIKPPQFTETAFSVDRFGFMEKAGVLVGPLS